MRKRLRWLLRGSTWRRRHLNRCAKCMKLFSDDEPGAWVGSRRDEFPSLCLTGNPATHPGWC